MAIRNQRWVVDSGILRKKDVEEEPQELLVFGYTCKLFRDDEKAEMIDHGKHLIPWMGDNTLKIDRYDGRGTLSDLCTYEAPPGGYDQRTILTEDGYKLEQACDEERYRSLYNNEAEESMHHDEEIKKLHQALNTNAVYSNVGFNYDEDSSKKSTDEDTGSPKQSDDLLEEDRAFIPEPELEIPENMVVPDTQKLNAIITKTALFISRQGGQMEVLLKAKQAKNPQFSFMSIDGPLYRYYKHVLEAIKSGKYNPEKGPEKKELEPVEESDEDDEPYLHPSLVSSLVKIEAAPNIPSIRYKPSENCAYSMLVSKITGKPAPSKVAPLLETPSVSQADYYNATSQQVYAVQPTAPQQYAHGPVLYSNNGSMQSSNASQVQAYSAPSQENYIPPVQKEPLVPYGPTPPKPLSRPSFIVPPADIQIIIDKMASYVAKNGRDFETIVKNKGDPRFNFLELSHQYHGYYAHKLTIYEGAVNPRVLTEEELLQKQEQREEKQKKLEELQKKQQRMEEVQKRVKMIQAKKKGDVRLNKQSSSKQPTTVSFSIKKPKDGESSVIEKRNALPIEESDDEIDTNKKESNSKSSSPQSAELDNNSLKSETEYQNIPDKKQKFEENEFVDLTDDILEDCQEDIPEKQLMEDSKNKITITREKIGVTSKERELQLERKKKAAMFLSQIQVPTLSKNEVVSSVAFKTDVDSDSCSAPSPPTGCFDTEENRTNSNSLMNRLKGADLDSKRPRQRSRSRSASCTQARDSRKTHRKHKKRKSSSRKRYHDRSPSSSRSRTKKRKKSSSRYRSRSRSPSQDSNSRYSNSRHSDTRHSNSRYRRQRNSSSSEGNCNSS